MLWEATGTEDREPSRGSQTTWNRTPPCCVASGRLKGFSEQIPPLSLGTGGCPTGLPRVFKETVVQGPRPITREQHPGPAVGVLPHLTLVTTPQEAGFNRIPILQTTKGRPQGQGTHPKPFSHLCGAGRTRPRRECQAWGILTRPASPTSTPETCRIPPAAPSTEPNPLALRLPDQKPPLPQPALCSVTLPPLCHFAITQ